MNIKENRHDVVDLWRFIGSIIIMTFHLYYCGFTDNLIPFATAWIYVEFFFIISGYYTISHFDKITINSLDDMAQNAIRYSIKKYLNFFPYVVIATSIYYCIDAISTDFSGGGDLINYVFDTLLLTNSFYNQLMRVRPLWFLSALFIVFPFFCFICQMKSKNILYLISFYVPLFFYGFNDHPSSGIFPHNVVRALAALFLGVLIYAICSVVKKVDFSTGERIILTVIEVGTSVSIIYFTFNRKLNSRFYIFCFVVFLTIMFSKQSYTNQIRGTVLNWLGKISMVIYIMHTSIAHYINTFLGELSLTYRILFYYLGSFIFSIIIYLLVEKIRKKYRNKVLRHSMENKC